MEEARIQEFIKRATEFLDNSIGNYAAFEKKRVDELDKDDIQSCMFIAITRIISPAQVLLGHNERHEIVDYWYDLYSYVPMNPDEIEELRVLQEYNKYLNEHGFRRLTQLWTRKDKEDKM